MSAKYLFTYLCDRWCSFDLTTEVNRRGEGLLLISPSAAQGSAGGAAGPMDEVLRRGDRATRCFAAPVPEALPLRAGGV